MMAHQGECQVDVNTEFNLDCKKQKPCYVEIQKPNWIFILIKLKYMPQFKKNYSLI